jgi:hypothetical protein
MPTFLLAFRRQELIKKSSSAKPEPIKGIDAFGAVESRQHRLPGGLYEMNRHTRISAAASIAFGALVLPTLIGGSISAQFGPPPVHPLFDLSSPDRSPFPSDRFTVADANQNTGRRVALPRPPDCTAEASDCVDVEFLNYLDGFNNTPRLSIPFDGDIDVTTATSANVFLVSLGDALSTGSDEASAYWGEPLPRGSIGRIVGITAVVWEPETRTLHATADASLDEHSRYALVVTRGLRDSTGRPIEPSDAFRRYRSDLAGASDPELRWYRRALLTAEWAARRAATVNQETAAVSLFSTQSATYLLEKVRARVQSAPYGRPQIF